MNNSPEITTTFELVIMVTVSKLGSVCSAQKDMADRLKVVLGSGESEERSSRTIFQYLHSKKYLLLIDDVWDDIDLAHLICLLVSSSANHFLKIPLGLVSRISHWSIRPL